MPKEVPASRFAGVAMTSEEVAASEQLRTAYQKLEDALAVVPASREKSLAITALEESSMWTTKAISRNGVEG